MVEGLSNSSHPGLSTDSTVTLYLFPSLSGTPGPGICTELTALVPLRYTPQYIPRFHLPSRAWTGQLRTRQGSTCPAQGADNTALSSSPAEEPTLLFPALRLNTREHSLACTWCHTLQGSVSQDGPQL